MRRRGKRRCEAPLLHTTLWILWGYADMSRNAVQLMKQGSNTRLLTWKHFFTGPYDMEDEVKSLRSRLALADARLANYGDDVRLAEERAVGFLSPPPSSPPLT